MQVHAVAGRGKLSEWTRSSLRVMSTVPRETRYIHRAQRQNIALIRGNSSSEEHVLTLWMCGFQNVVLSDVTGQGHVTMLTAADARPRARSRQQSVTLKLLGRQNQSTDPLHAGETRNMIQRRPEWLIDRGKSCAFISVAGVRPMAASKPHALSLQCWAKRFGGKSEHSLRPRDLSIESQWSFMEKQTKNVDDIILYSTFLSNKMLS